MENKPGNGYTSPFGNEKGATMADGPSTGAHNFIEDPASHAPETGGRDFTKESRDQPNMNHAAGGGSYDPSSVPAGGTMPFGTGDSWAKAEEDVDGLADDVKQMPFKNLR